MRWMLGVVVGVGACVGPEEGPEPVDPTTDTGTPEPPGPGPTEDPLRVDTDAGPVQGVLEEGARAFLGIPYAAPPVGALRWTPPQPPAPWTEPLDATTYGAPCPQDLSSRAAEDGAPDPFGEEDCLFLNVWAPEEAEARPVLVFLHGGGNFTGAGDEPLDGLLLVDGGPPAYAGARVASRGDAVVVTLNYRLGALGFLALPELADRSPHGTAGNYGLLDQVAALQWVQRNIAAFGGDPARVLLFGQSGGAYDVCAHLTSAGSAGLFQRAAMHSGVCSLHDLAVAEATAQDLVDELCPGASDPVACLLDADPEALVLAEAAQPSGLGSFAFHPHVDGVVFAEHPMTVVQEGRQHPVPLLVSTLADEYAHRFTEPFPDLVFGALVEAQVGADRLDEALQLYDPAVYGDTARAYAALVTDRNLTCTSRRIARGAVQAAPVWRAHFRQVLPGPEKLGDGAYHTTDLLYLFQHMDGTWFEATDDDREVEDAMLRSWVAIADSGDPATDGLAWPAYEVEGDPVQVLAEPPSTDALLATEACDFWDGFLPGQ